MNQMNKKIRLLLFSAVSLLAAVSLPVVAFAQDPGGGPDAPIDGGLGVLLAAGAAYGVKKYRENRKQRPSHTGETTTSK